MVQLAVTLDHASEISVFLLHVYIRIHTFVQVKYVHMKVLFARTQSNTILYSPYMCLF